MSSILRLVTITKSSSYYKRDMGAYASSFRTNNEKSIFGTTPHNADWITAHATITRLTVVEVERLWMRFQQLGCNEQGILTMEALSRPPTSNDVFIKMILTAVAFGEPKIITFQCFLNLMQWAEVSSLETKLRGIFHLINGGRSVTKESLLSALRQTYYEDSTDDVENFAEVLFRQMDRQRKGYIEEETFVSFARMLPADTFDVIMNFNIVPPEVNDEAHRAFTAGYRPRPIGGGTGSVANVQDHGVPTDDSLVTVASKIQQKDWHILANKLNFTTKEATNFEKRHAKDRQKQIYEMLRFWKQRDGASATVDVLAKALQNSNMADAIPFVHS